MPFIVTPSRNKMLDRAWTDHKAAQRDEARAAKKAKPVEEEPVPVKKAGKRKPK